MPVFSCVQRVLRLRLSVDNALAQKPVSIARAAEPDKETIFSVKQIVETLAQAQYELRQVRRQRNENRKRISQLQLECRTLKNELDKLKEETSALLPLSASVGAIPFWVAPMVLALHESRQSPESLAAICTRIAKDEFAADSLERLVLSAVVVELEPKPYRQKWYAINLAKHGFVGEANDIIESIRGRVGFSKSEQRVVDKIQTEVFQSRSIDRNLDLFIDSHIDYSGATALLYADIDLNIVDGSSIWLSSVASMLSSFQRTIILLKKNIKSHVTWSNINNRTQLYSIEPSDLGVPGGVITVSDAQSIIRILDDRLPSLRYLFVRGADAATSLHSDRQFHRRTNVYLTDFYKYESGVINVASERVKSIDQLARQSGCFLVQTLEIEQKLNGLTDVPIKSFRLPPPVPDDLPVANLISRRSMIKIGYAGKINPDWGIVELIEWIKVIKLEGTPIELFIVANKISGQGPITTDASFVNKMRSEFASVGITHYEKLNRAQSMELMSEMDFVWCYRPPVLEDSTLEVSTKLIEMAAVGARCVCYPSVVNTGLLGSDYGFFIRNIDELRQLILSAPWAAPSSRVSERLRDDHGMTNIRARLLDRFGTDANQEARVVCFSGHDFKFIDPFISSLKIKGIKILRDRWDWGQPIDVRRSLKLANQSDIVFCEWGLANAEWYSKHKPASARLFIRVHLQEVNSRAARFGAQINIASVEKVIFVSDEVKSKAMELWGWPEYKLVTIPNFVLDDEYLVNGRSGGRVIRLGMVGIVPRRKRLDRAVKLLRLLHERGESAELHIKGPRPEELPFMNAPGRIEEMDFYTRLYSEIEADPYLNRSIFFEPWGNDMAFWYRKIDVILSPSDFESFHYALADGVLSGCHPIVWPWAGAERLYTADWLVSDENDALASVIAFRDLSTAERDKRCQDNRELVVNKYGRNVIFNRLSDVIFGSPPA